MQRRTDPVLFSTEEGEEGDVEDEVVSSNCAWCGDPPDQYGSHGICTYHAEQMVEQAHSRRHLDS
jgi:hypothetical protein